MQLASMKQTDGMWGGDPTSKLEHITFGKQIKQNHDQAC